MGYTLKDFKKALNKYLQSVPDQPGISACAGLWATVSKSLVDHQHYSAT